MGRLDGKVIIITGCSAGIGKQVAIYFAREGAKLVICARREDKLRETERLCAEAGAEVLAMVCDISKTDEQERLVAATIERFGALDVLINNAEDATHGKTLRETTLEDVRHAMDANFFANWNLMQLCYPYLKECGQGSIVNVCSGAGILGIPRQGAYACTKEALRGLSRVAAKEWGADNIRVNVVCPGAMTDTVRESPYASIMEQMAKNTPLQRVGDAYDDIAPVYLFFASDDSRFVTGQTVNCEGGLVILP
jgi:NAD(P)-dependent dehydrogenase (short-subunit alcohol dehydrogenase family)